MNLHRASSLADTALTGNPETQTVINNFLQSLQGGNFAASTQQQIDRPFASLSELLIPDITIPALSNASEEHLESLLSLLPPTLTMLAAGGAQDDSVDVQNPDPETLEAIKMSLSMEQKRQVLNKVLRSPQFSQSLSSLTDAISDGGLPTISEALKVPMEHGGYNPGGAVPLEGANAIDSFLKGMKKKVEDEKSDGAGGKDQGGNDRMDVG